MKRLASLLIGIALSVGLLAQPEPKPDPKDTGKKAHQTPQAVTATKKTATKKTTAKKTTKKEAETKKGQSTNTQGRKAGSSGQ